MPVSVIRGCLSAVFFVVLSLFVAPSAHAAGALAIGKCGAYGQAFDYSQAQAAIDAARKQCKGECKTVSVRKACAALSLDMKNPCGAYGYAVEPRISKAQNAAMKKCYAFGGKECVIRAWACDAKG